LVILSVSIPVTDRLLPPEDLWKGFVCDRGELAHHTGTHLLRVSRPYFGSIADGTIFPATDVWDRHDEYSAVYIQLNEDTKTAKARINAFRQMDPRVSNTPAGRRDLGLDEAEMIYGRGDMLFNPDDEDERWPEEDEDVPEPIDFTNQKAIVVGRELTKPPFVDFFFFLGLSQ